MSVEGGLYVTNSTGTAVFELHDARAICNGGSIEADQLICGLGGGLPSILTVNSGTLKCKSAIVTNGLPLVIGDGTNTANLVLQGGTNLFGNGLIINSNSLLSGTGAITGSVLLQGSLTNDSGILTFTGPVTNNGTIFVHGNVVFAGLLVNNGTVLTSGGGSVFYLKGQTKFYGVTNWVVDVNGGGVAAPVNGPNYTVFGDTTGTINNAANNFQASSSIAPGARAITLTNIGDAVTLSGTVSLGNSVGGNIQYRLGLFYKGASSTPTNWLGYWFGNGVLSGGTPILNKRDNPNTGSYASLTGSSNIGSTNGPGGMNFGDGIYTVLLSVQRPTTNTLLIQWDLISQNLGNYDIEGITLDTSPNTFSFDEVGMLSGGSLGAEFITYTNLTVTYNAAIPNPLPKLLGITPQGTDAQLSWLGAAGSNYVVQATTNLSLNNSFRDISSIIPLTGSAVVLTNYLDAGALTNAPARFYRIRSN